MPERLALTDQQFESATERLMQWLAIASVSTDPAYAASVQQGAQWAASHLRDSGLEVEISPTPGHPVVLARTLDHQVENPQAPRLLFYGHYDVQPPDPLDKWTSEPFKPEIREGADGPAIFARGACDDKGQVAGFLEAVRLYHQAGQLWPGPFTIMLEGEEECGSEHLADWMQTHREALAADVALICDTSMWAPGWPAITYGLRGLVYFDLKLHGPSRDLHSGVYGGSLANPATLLVRVLGRLFDDQQRITIPGIYDDVLPVERSEQEAWGKLNFDDEAFLKNVGAQPFGEAGYSTLERRWARPSCDVNGLYGGYMGEGAKTVIPSFAGAKVSFRIPPAMDPGQVARQFRQWLESQEVGGCRWELTHHGEAWPVKVPTDSKWVQAVSRAVQTSSGQAPALVREGATIPVVAELKTLLGLDTILLGFGLDSDRIHSPNEHFSLERFRCAITTLAEVLKEVAAVQHS